MTTTRETLGWGYRRGEAGRATVAWGARLIFDEISYGSGVVASRTDFIGDDPDREEFRRYLVDTIGERWVDVLRKKIQHGTVQSRDDEEVVLYDDKVARVVGSPQKSYGYFYVTAYRKDSVVTEEESEAGVA